MILILQLCEFPVSCDFSDPNKHPVDQGIQQGADTPQAGYQGLGSRRPSWLLDLQAQAAKTSVLEARSQVLEAELEQLKASWWYRVWCWFKTPTV